MTPFRDHAHLRGVKIGGMATATPLSIRLTVRMTIPSAILDPSILTPALSRSGFHTHPYTYDKPISSSTRGSQGLNGSLQRMVR